MEGLAQAVQRPLARRSPRARPAPGGGALGRRCQGARSGTRRAGLGRDWRCGAPSPPGVHGLLARPVGAVYVVPGFDNGSSASWSSASSSLFSLGAHTRGREIGVSVLLVLIGGRGLRRDRLRQRAESRATSSSRPSSWVGHGPPAWPSGCGASWRWRTSGCASSRRRRPVARSRRSGRRSPGSCTSGLARHLRHGAAVAGCADACSAATRSGPPRAGRDRAHQHPGARRHAQTARQCSATPRALRRRRRTRRSPRLPGWTYWSSDVRGSGLPVQREPPARPDVPPGVDLSAYRIVQEALTNVLKHAGPAPATGQ